MAIDIMWLDLEAAQKLERERTEDELARSERAEKKSAKVLFTYLFCSLFIPNKLFIC